tara:strand:- start:1520 stop:2176 length:657 start_codon:yes stop_codon:yes gene_type:complete
MIFPKKPEILYAPMLATFGGGSANGFKASGGGGAFAGNEVGYPNTTMTNATTSWFSAGSYGYLGVDVGADYKFTAGQDVSTAAFRWLGTSTQSNSFYILVFEFVAGHTYDVHYGFRVDSVGNTYNVVQTMAIANSPQTFGNPVIPSTGDYYLGWRSGVPSGVGYGSSGNIWAESTTSEPNSISKWASTQGSSNTAPYAGERITFNMIDQQDYIALRIE